VTVTRLAVGDYRVENRLVVERKTVTDFAASLVDGRLLRQAKRLADLRMRTVCVLEGRPRYGKVLGVPRHALQGAMVALTVQFGIPVLRSSDPAETARLIVYAGRQMRRCARGAVRRNAYRPRGRRKQQLFILQGLPGVGPMRAANLLDRLGSLEAVFMAEEEELAEIEGIGAGLATRIRRLTAPPKPSHSRDRAAAPQAAAAPPVE
jgi:ERCC4-type nuclease